MSETDSESKTKSDVYHERNLLAIAFVQQYRNTPFDHGWWPDTDDVNDEEWAVVWADTNGGQVGWHVPREMVPDWLPKEDLEYDGYTTTQKNARVARRVGLEEA